MNKWDVNQLKHFISIYELNSISNAAIYLGLSQSALTKSLKKLEENLGLVLFDRHTRELKPTMAARDLYSHAIEVIGSSRDFTERAAQLAEGRWGCVKVGQSPIASQLFTQRLVKAVSDLSPSIRLEFSTGNFTDLQHGLLNHEYDFLVYDTGNIEDANIPEQFNLDQLADVDLEIVISPQHPEYGVIDNYFKFKWALPSMPSRFIKHAPSEIYHEAMRSGIPHYQIESMDQCLDIARKGLAVSVAPRELVEDDISRGELVALDFGVKLKADFGIYKIRARKYENNVLKIIKLLKKCVDAPLSQRANNAHGSFA